MAATVENFLCAAPTSPLPIPPQRLHANGVCAYSNASPKVDKTMDDELSNQAVGKRVAADYDFEPLSFSLALRFEVEKLIKLETEIIACLLCLDCGASIQPNSALHILLRKAYDGMHSNRKTFEG
jgi:hypothetical protein